MKLFDLYRTHNYTVNKGSEYMKLINYKQPMHILEIPFLISQSMNYEKEGRDLFNLTESKEMVINSIYPNFFDKYEKLLKDSSMVLKEHTKIKELHSLKSFGLFTEIMYHTSTFDFKNITFIEFTKSALTAILISYSDTDLDNIDELYDIRNSIMKGGTLRYDMLFTQVQKFDVKDKTKFKVFEFFYDIESIYKEYKIVYNKLLKEYNKFSNGVDVKFNIEKEPQTIKDLKLDNLIDIESFKDSSPHQYYYSYSLILYKGIVAKVSMDKDELSFTMKGILFDLLEEFEKDNVMSISNIETQISALGDKKRMKIFTLLLHKEYYLKELAEALELSSSTLSHHMDILVSAELVSIRAKGKKTYYRLNPEEIKKVSMFFNGVLNHLGDVQ